LVPEVDCFVDCVGFSCSGHAVTEKPVVVLNQAMAITEIGSIIGIPGLYVTEDPGATKHQNKGAFKIRFDW
jgi:glutathione-independent formaldehyde dehydrogenase